MSDHMVDIVDTIPNTERVWVTELKADDIIFDCFGSELPLARVVHFKKSVRTVRQDGGVDLWDKAQIITRKRRNDTQEA